MQAMTQGELDHFVKETSAFVGSEFRQFRYDESALQIQLENSGQLIWITMSLKPGNPYVFFSKQRIYLVKNLKKPFQLFLKTHFIDVTLTKIERVDDLGRVLRFSFKGRDGDYSLEFFLIPGRVNIAAHAGDKAVYINKPKELDINNQQKPFAEQGLRENNEFSQFWEKKFNTDSSKQKTAEPKELKKKQSGLRKMQEKLEALQEDKWRKLGDQLTASQSLQGLPKELASLVDLDQTIHDNIEQAYSLSKKNKDKIVGTIDRIETLKKEILSLESGKNKINKKTVKESLFNTAQAKGKTLSFSEGRVFIGKSGPENLKLLRKAKPWYLWFHIKDYPGAYGIFEKNKGKNVSEVSLKEASLAVVRQSLPKGAQGTFEVIYAECRYVRPIKGAKSGQVTYSHEKILSIKVEG